jgi:hypothetical protein
MVGYIRGRVLCYYRWMCKLIRIFEIIFKVLVSFIIVIVNIFIFRFFKIFLQNTLMSSSSPSIRRQTNTPTTAINIYSKQKKDDVVDTIFDENAALELSDIISDFIVDRFNHFPTLFTVPQLKCICSKVRQ